MSEKVIKAGNVKRVVNPSPSAIRFFRSQIGGDQDTIPLGLSQPIAVDLGLDKVEKRMAESRKEGYDCGFAEGIAFQKKERVQSFNAFDEVIQELGQLKAKLYAESEEGMLNLVFSIAEKVIYEEASKNREVVPAILREAVKQVLDRDGMKIRLSPLDYRFMIDIKQDFLQEVNAGKNVIFEEDSSIKPGGAVLETNSGEVDARLEHQLKEIRSALTSK